LYQLYADRESLAGLEGADLVTETVLVNSGTSGSTKDAGDLSVVPGLRVKGRIVIDGEGKKIPVDAKGMLGRSNAWDSMDVKIAADGTFSFVGLKGENFDFTPSIPGFLLSPQKGDEIDMDEHSIHFIVGSGEEMVVHCYEKGDLAPGKKVYRARVVGPDGKAVPDARIHSQRARKEGSQKEWVMWTSGELLGGEVRTRSADNGTFSIEVPVKEEQAVLIVSPTAGYRFVPMGDLRGDIQLLPWHVIEGKALRNGKPEKGLQVALTCRKCMDVTDFYRISITLTTSTDEKGRFTFLHVPKELVQLSRKVNDVDMDVDSILPRPRLAATGAPEAETTDIVLGKSGAVITGKLDLPAADLAICDFTNGSLNLSPAIHQPIPRPPANGIPAEITAWYDAWHKSPEGLAYALKHRRYKAIVAEDGTFRFEDVLPGTYLISGEVRQKGSNDMAARFGSHDRELPITVTAEQAEGRSEIRAPHVEYTLLNSLAPGKYPPAFSFDCGQGRTFTEADLKGKITVFSFNGADDARVSKWYSGKLNDLAKTLPPDSPLQWFNFNSSPRSPEPTAAWACPWPLLPFAVGYPLTEKFQTGYNAYIVFDETGKVIFHKSYQELAVPVIVKAVQRLMAEQNKSGTTKPPAILLLDRGILSPIHASTSGKVDSGKTTELKGVVQDLSGKPLARVRVQLSKDPLRATYTDDDGAFSLTDIPDGMDHSAWIMLAGYTPQLLPAETGSDTLVKLRPRSDGELKDKQVLKGRITNHDNSRFHTTVVVPRFVRLSATGNAELPVATAEPFAVCSEDGQFTLVLGEKGRYKQVGLEVLPGLEADGARAYSVGDPDQPQLIYLRNGVVVTGRLVKRGETPKAGAPLLPKDKPGIPFHPVVGVPVKLLFTPSQDSSGKTDPNQPESANVFETPVMLTDANGHFYFERMPDSPDYVLDIPATSLDAIGAAPLVKFKVKEEAGVWPAVLLGNIEVKSTEASPDSSTK
ncbi:MAG: hypothetical protein ACAI35_06385, partial [Candidatus Methylacidiphilales bacterium]